MKHFVILIFVFLGSFCLTQTPGEWTWMAGSNNNQTTIPGIKGVPSPSNTPGLTYESANWTDLDGNFWWYSSYGYGNNLWKYDVSIGQWAWMNGLGLGSLSNDPVFGTQGIFADSINPGFVALGKHAEWVDSNGDLWFFNISDGYIGSMWKYNISLNQWAWMHGNIPYNIGVQGISDPLNNPFLKESPVSWVSADGKFWLWEGLKSRLFRYDPIINEWTWMHGNPSTTLILDTIGVYSSENQPESTEWYQFWKSNDGTFYLFGGIGGDPFSSFLSKNNMWQFNPFINQWRLVTGLYSDSTANFTTNCLFDASFRPSNKREQRISWKGLTNLFYGVDEYSGGYIWCFDPEINEYALVEGTITTPGAIVNPVFGTLGNSSPINKIGTNYLGGFSSWTDLNGNFWKLGSGSWADTNRSNALWRYIPDTSCIKGSLSVSIFASSNEGCVPLTVNFSPMTINNTTNYIWDFGVLSSSEDTSTLNNPSYTYTSTGIYTVQLVASANISGEIQYDTTEIIITVVDPPIILLISDTTICKGSSVELLAEGASIYTWNNSPDLNTTIGSTVLASPINPTTYIVTGTTMSCSSTDSVFVNLVEPEILVTSDSVCIGKSVQLKATGADYYFWSPETFLDNTSGSVVIATPTSNINYTVIGSLDGIENCSDTAISVLTIIPENSINCKSSFYVPNVFSPNGDNLNDYFYISTSNVKELYFVIVNRWGNIVYEGSTINSKWDGYVNGKPVTEGVYFVRYSILNNLDENIEGQTYLHLVK